MILTSGKIFFIEERYLFCSSISFESNLENSAKVFRLEYLFFKNKNNDIFFLMGADNLVNFHKWNESLKIAKKCKIIVFDRHGYKKKSLNSKTFKRLNNKNLKFIEFNKVNISSSKLRKI